MSYSKDVIDRVIEENDIVDVVSSYVSLKKSGKDFKGLCPFHHEKTPSFNVSQEKQLYHCFGCQASGNVITFVMNIENVGFKEAVEFLADRAGIEIEEENLSGLEYQKKKLKDEIYEVNRLAALFYHRYLYSKFGQAALKYLYDRGIDDITIKRFGLGFSPPSGLELLKYLKRRNYNTDVLVSAGLVSKSSTGSYYDRFKNRVMFPIIDEKNNVIGFGGRVMDDAKPKYLNTPETVVFKKGKTLYGINYAKKSKEDMFIIVEGYMDAIALYQSGLDNVVASLGTALTLEQGRLIKKYKNTVVISYDADEAGIEATMRGLNLLDELDLNVNILTVPNGKDPDEYVRKEGFDAFKKLLEKTDTLIEYKIKKYKQDLDLEKPSDRIKYIKKVCKDLATVKDEVKRDVYISIVSEDAEIPENTIRAEIDQFVKGFLQNNKKIRYTVGNNRHNIKYSGAKKIPSLKYLIALLLIDNKLYSRVKGKLSVDDIEDEHLKAVMSYIFERLEDGGHVDVKDLSFMLDNADLKDEFNDIFNVLYSEKVASEKIVDDCVREIIKDDIRRKIASIKREIDDSYNAGDIEKERELLIQLQKYEKEMLNLKNG
ncbi:DNA primase [Thermoanaerobacterium xylanolyticum LX-11]|uniref:DNA primase n=1 Tax=Thermoanaerobacterium xylanolyticum (strain ATCC 49914 / DSM 7097 / LX-11) TaxID=858215 RepID=F6BJ32_THEXL|nr:DNA primase [Thermoanaerobacterium xylanolyticum]AEF16864.1 DNA primase [Thermoanaerobacterium xylanolyticum LX-11]